MSDKIKTIVVDDEPEAREGLRFLLSDIDYIDLVAECKNGIEAIDLLLSERIDLMFLDIQMPVVDGFEVISSVPKDRLPHIIFTTAHDQFALKAFEVNAVDYLLKPFSDQRFHEALIRAQQLLASNKIDEQNKLIQLVTNRSNLPESEAISLGQEMNRLIIKDSGRILFVDLSDIIWVEAFDYYVKVHVKENFYLMRKSMKYLESVLPPASFKRIHKSSIINTKYISAVQKLKHGDAEVVLSNGTTLKVGRSYRENVKY